MNIYEPLSIPDSCKVGNTIFKKLFYENADLSPKDKSLFSDGIDKITWLYCLKPETINIQAYKDESRDYPEIEVIEVTMVSDTGIKRITEIIMRSIPYPMLLFFRWENKIKLCMAHQRISLNDSSKITLEETIETDWLSKSDSLFSRLSIIQMRYTNFLTLYSDIIDAVSLYVLSHKTGLDCVMSGADARMVSSRIDMIQSQICMLKSELQRESQFNRKIDLNIEIQKLKSELSQITGGIQR